MLSRGLTQVTHKAIFVFHSITKHACQLPASTLPARFKLVVAYQSTILSGQLLVFCSTIVVSSYSNSYELVTVIAVPIC
ncbi:unnamed protein product [Hymenolepis diminuta]|uniref:Uncharacterized protein n=1 Tax=Hymenolepis diminuta TaxID=6216 RepID=A0A564YA20_HYMDI|nr:unnamed protein product [Hymenolepis diminuta]